MWTTLLTFINIYLLNNIFLWRLASWIMNLITLLLFPTMMYYKHCYCSVIVDKMIHGDQTTHPASQIVHEKVIIEI